MSFIPKNKIKKVPLRTAIAKYIFICTIPLAFLALIVSGNYIQMIRKQHDHEAWMQVRNLGLTIDREILSRISALQILSTTPKADSPTLIEDFYEEAQRFRVIFPGHIILADLSSQMLFNTRLPLGSSLPVLPMPKGFAAAPAALETGTPAVGDMFLGPIAKKTLVAIVVPILRQGQTKALLLNIIETQQYQEILEDITIPSGYSVRILDSVGGAIASYPLAAQNNESTDRKYNSRHFTVKSNVSHWSVVFDVPTEIHNKPIFIAFFWVTFALLTAISISILGGRLAGRRLTQSLMSITDNISPPFLVTEIEDVRVLLDETDRARQSSEEDVRKNEKLYRSLFEVANVGKSITLPNGEMQVNQAFCDLLGYTQLEIQNVTWQELTPEEEIQTIENILADLKNGCKKSARFNKRYIHKDGSHIWADVSTIVQQDDDGSPLYFITTIIDISAQVSIDKQLKSSEERFSAAFHYSPAGLTITSVADGKFIDVNNAFLNMFEFTREEVIGHNSVELKMLSPQEREELIIAQLKVEGLQNHEISARSKSGRMVAILFSSQPLQLRGETFHLTTMIDITERKRTQEKYLSALKYFETVFKKSPIGIATIRADGTILSTNEALASIIGGEVENIVNLNINDINTWSVSGLHASAQQVIDTQVEKLDEYHYTSSFGKECWVECLFVPFKFEGEQQLLMLMNDIRGRKRAEEEQKKLQNQFLQAQKMESVGRLAGGVAHDFNNMLSVIIGYSELVIDKVDPTGPLYSDLLEIFEAAKRSSDIVRQLLAFSRQQTTAPEVLNLNDSTESMLKMLQRLIGEDIDLAWLPGSDLWSVNIDPSQVDQILANLCVNSRDAMKGVGKLTIETGNANFDEEYCADHEGFVPGNFVLLAVSDTGGGIAPELLDKIFEPFFTTKGLHQGTGLGLSTVYGIVKQNSGFVNVYSELSKGTTIKIYLPQHEGEPGRVNRESARELPLSRGETILVVEDDPSILSLCEKMLKKFGYTILSTSIPSVAIELAKEHANKINLLITDVVMPEMSGRELSKELKKQCPNLKILFMSGYTADVIAHRGVLEEGVNFIPKPLSHKELAIKVREVLDLHQ